MVDRLVKWLKGMAQEGGKGVVNNIDARALGRVACELDVLQAASSVDIRQRGWMVAVHNDYTLNEERYTFWLMTKGDRCVKGEGKCDQEALAEIRAKIDRMEE